MKSPEPLVSTRPYGRFSTVLLIGLVLCLVTVLPDPRPASAHGAPIIDGLYTGDWCAPGFVLAFGPDSLTLVTPAGPPPGCPLGSEILWDDWESVFYGGGLADTMGWLVGGVVGAPLTDPEVDLDFFATTANAATVFFTVQLGPFPSTTGIPPHVQIAIDLDGAATGNPFWYDPLGVGTLPMGLVSLPAPIFADYLITTDGPLGIAYVWEATSVPGAWTLAAPVPLVWSGVFAPPGAPSVIELGVPWGLFAPGPVFVPGVPASMAIMTAHGLPFAPGGVADAPMTPADDVFSEAGFGFTASPDLCPPGPPSTDCEIYFGPGGGAGSTDSYIAVLYPTADLAITKTNGVSSVIPGTPVTYTITATNAAGPSTATGATITDTFPAPLTGCTWTCVGSGGGVCAAAGAGNISDSITLPAGGTVTYTATCTLPSNATGSLVNTAAVLAPVGIIDPAGANDSATDTDTILGLDYGDAPDPTYPTLLASNGARHAITGAFLGGSVDSELDGQPTATANGDDSDGNDDEDGVSFTSTIVAGQLSTLTVTASGPGLLDAWIDFNADGDWFDAGEQIFTSIPLTAGANALSFTPPSSASAGSTFARFRFSQGGGLAPTGLAIDGEVEDEPVAIIRSSDVAITKTDSRDPATAGIGLRYTLANTNNGPSDATGLTVTDTLPGATTFLSAVPGSPTCSHSSGTVTCNLGGLAAGADTDVVVTVLVNSGTTGSISNTAGVSAIEPDPVSSNDTDIEGTTIVTPLFADAFESGDTSAWDNQVPESTMKTIRLKGPTGELRASFRLDPSVLRRLRGQPVPLIVGIDEQDRAVFRVEARGRPAQPAIRVETRADDGRWARTTWRPLETAPGWFDLWWRRSLEDLTDGAIEVRNDGSVVLALEDLNNHGSAVSALKVAELKGRSAVREVSHR